MISQNLNLSLKKIRDHIGLEDFKQLIEEWYIIAQNVNTLPKGTFNIRGSGANKIIRNFWEGGDMVTHIEGNIGISVLVSLY